MGTTDPLGYYACLGVAPTAPASVIKAAYRALAMERHPDRNEGFDATRRFQELQRAYDVLSDPVERAAYDASSVEPALSTASSTVQEASSSSTRASTGTTSYEPVRCSRCNSLTASPRYRVFFRVFSYVVGATRQPFQGVYCARCEMYEGAKSTGITVVTGWWSLHGFFWSLDALYQNLFGANAFSEQNAKLLAHQAGYFLSTGNRTLALAIAREAYAATLRVRNPNSRAARMRAKLGYKVEDQLKELRENLNDLIQSAGSDEAIAKLRNGVGMMSPALYAQSAIVAVLTLALGTWWFVEYKRSVDAEEARLLQAGIEYEKAAAIARQQQATLAANLQPLPPSGEHKAPPWRQFATNQPPFKVTAGRGVNYFIKLADWQSGVAVMAVFVRAGEQVEIGVPPGTYRVKFASGQQWYGEDIWFGPDTDYSMVGTPVTFSVQGNQLLGHELKLEQVLNGNLRRQKITAAGF